LIAQSSRELKEFIIEFLEIIKKEMKNIRKIIFELFAFSLAIIGMTSCNLLGLDVQQNYDYHYSPTKLKMDMTAYQFIESRKNIDMSLLYEAINRVQYKDSFETKNRTYIVLNDIALNNFLTYQHFGGLKYMSNLDIIKMLNKHIVKGLYHSLSLTITPDTVYTLDPAVKLTLALQPVNSDLQNKYQVMVKNLVTGSTISIVTSNLQPTNGIMHVTDQPL